MTNREIEAEAGQNAETMARSCDFEGISINQNFIDSFRMSEEERLKDENQEDAGESS